MIQDDRVRVYLWSPRFLDEERQVALAVVQTPILDFIGYLPSRLKNYHGDRGEIPGGHTSGGAPAPMNRSSSRRLALLRRSSAGQGKDLTPDLDPGEAPDLKPRLTPAKPLIFF
jgi:hypothetical protein